MKSTNSKKAILIMIALFTTISSNAQKNTAKSIQPDMIVRMSEIEIHPEHLEEYKMILKEEAAASVKLEKGVTCIFPMYEKEEPTHIRILEIYANQVAYQSHLKTPHFLHYKTTTLKMVKSLKLVDMTAIDPNTMQAIFRKL